MFGTHSTRRAGSARGAFLLMATGLVAACSAKARPVATPPPAGPVASTAAPQVEAPPPQGPSVRELEERIRGLELRILERESEIQDLEDRLEAQQGILDEAIKEVVRAKAKLLSLDSRAEAASQMAESEIALKALQDRVAGTEDPDVQQIRQLLQMGSQEFEKGNFGGALYLTIQAKTRIQSAQMRLRERERANIGADEVPFVAPLSMKVTKTSNVRAQPDYGSSILTTVGAGKQVTGLSHKGEWVRVVCDDGTRGWIHQSLLSGR